MAASELFVNRAALDNNVGHKQAKEQNCTSSNGNEQNHKASFLAGSVCQLLLGISGVGCRLDLCSEAGFRTVWHNSCLAAIELLKQRPALRDCHDVDTNEKRFVLANGDI